MSSEKNFLCHGLRFLLHLLNAERNGRNWHPGRRQHHRASYGSHAYGERLRSDGVAQIQRRGGYGAIGRSWSTGAGERDHAGETAGSELQIVVRGLAGIDRDARRTAGSRAHYEIGPGSAERDLARASRGIVGDGDISSSIPWRRGAECDV